MTDRSALGWFCRTAVMSGSRTGLPPVRVAPKRANRARTREGVDSSLSDFLAHAPSVGGARRQTVSTACTVRPSRRERPCRNAQLEHDLDRGDRGAGALDEQAGGLGRASGGEDVVDHEDALAVDERVGVHLDLGRAVLERVGLGQGLARELAGLADRHQAEAELVGDGARRG